MKKPAFNFSSVLLLVILSMSFFNSQAQTTNRIRIIFGTRSHPATKGDGCEGEKGICLILQLVAPRDGMLNPGTAEIYIEKGKLRFNILEDASPATSSEQYLNIYCEKILDPESSRLLGFDQVILLPGKYLLDKSRNALGSALITVKTY